MTVPADRGQGIEGSGRSHSGMDQSPAAGHSTPGGGPRDGGSPAAGVDAGSSREGVEGLAALAAAGPARQRRSAGAARSDPDGTQSASRRWRGSRLTDGGQSTRAVRGRRGSQSSKVPPGSVAEPSPDFGVDGKRLGSAEKAAEAQRSAKAADARKLDGPARSKRVDLRPRRQPKRGRRVSERRPQSWPWRYLFPVVLALLVVSIPVLMMTGWSLLLQSKEGKFEVSNRDEKAPGYQAITPPTPTLLLIQVDDTGQLAGLTVASQTSDKVGGVVFIPVTTVPAEGKAPLSRVFADSGQSALVSAVQALLGAGMQEVQVIDANQWASLLTNVGPLSFVASETIDVPGVGTFPKGPIVLEPSAVGGYLATPSLSGDDLSRLHRNEEFWNALIVKLATGPVELRGDTEAGLTHFLPALAKAQVAVEALSVKPVPTLDRKGTLYLAPDAQAQIARIIPFPIEATPGSRLRTRVLDGTGKLEHGVGATPALVAAGAQISGIGNAAGFDVKTTQVIFYEDTQRPAAEKLLAALGVGELAKSADPVHDVDVTVILGGDYAAKPPSSQQTVITSPPQNLGTVPVTIKGGTGA